MPMERTGLEITIPDWYGLHDGFVLKLTPGYTALAGPNGSGKTTLLAQIEEHARMKDWHVIRYSNLTDGGQAAMQTNLAFGDMAALAMAACNSEGQNVSLNFGNFLPKARQAIHRTAGTDTPLLILLDSLDSGSSLDRLRDVMAVLDLMLADAAGLSGGINDDVYILNAANDFAMVRDRDCVNVRTGRHLRFTDYGDYERFVCDYFESHEKIK